MTEIEVLRELYRITARKDGAIFRTKYVRDVWTDPDAAPPEDHVWAVKSDPDVVTVRVKK